MAQADHDERIRRIGALLEANRKGTENWGEISHLSGKSCSKKIANKFLACCLLDYQMDSNRAWENGYRLVEDILEDREDIWNAITSVSEAEWASRWNEYKLHRFPAGHNRLWRIGKVICNEYGGDARRIWEGKESQEVVERLSDLGAGEQISRMIVGALRDCGQIQGMSDVKADVYVCRVLGRAILGEAVDAATAAEIARQLHPSDPWQLDWPLWQIGKSYCHVQRPNCLRCYLAPLCVYSRNAATARTVATDIPLRGITAEVPQVGYEEAKAQFARALSVTTYDSAKPRFLYFEFEKGKYEKVPFAAYADWIEKSPKTATYPEWRLKKHGLSKEPSSVRLADSREGRSNRAQLEKRFREAVIELEYSLRQRCPFDQRLGADRRTLGKLIQEAERARLLSRAQSVEAYFVNATRNTLYHHGLGHVPDEDLGRAEGSCVALVKLLTESRQ